MIGLPLLYSSNSIGLRLAKLIGGLAQEASAVATVAAISPILIFTVVTFSAFLDLYRVSADENNFKPECRIYGRFYRCWRAVKGLNRQFMAISLLFAPAFEQALELVRECLVFEICQLSSVEKDAVAFGARFHPDVRLHRIFNLVVLLA